MTTVTSTDLLGGAVGNWAYRTDQMEIGTLVLMVYLAAIIWNLRSKGNRLAPGDQAARAVVAVSEVK